MVANDKVSVTLRDGFKFTGVVKSVEGVTVIVKFNEPEAEDRRNAAFDPEGCLAVHMSFVKALLACVLLACALSGCASSGGCTSCQSSVRSVSEIAHNLTATSPEAVDGSK